MNEREEIMENTGRFSARSRDSLLAFTKQKVNHAGRVKENRTPLEKQEVVPLEKLPLRAPGGA